MLNDSTIDFAANLMSVTADRSEVVGFSIDKEMEGLKLYVKPQSQQQRNAAQIIALIRADGWITAIATVIVGMIIMVVITVTTRTKASPVSGKTFTKRFEDHDSFMCHTSMTHLSLSFQTATLSLYSACTWARALPTT